MASFSWMLMEGIHLYRITVLVFNSDSKKYSIFAFGYGVPLIICSVSFLFIYVEEGILFDALIGDYL
jgi:hypothetical protein